MLRRIRLQNGVYNLPFAWMLHDAYSKSTFNYFSFYLFSNCVKFGIFPRIKSLYTNIDINVSWLYENNKAATSGKTLTEKVVIRNIRLVKLFPEGGVFQD
jgi:hypothetical protein